MHIRRAERHEADDLATVWLRSRLASVPAIPRPVHADAEIRAWFEHVVLVDKEVWVATTDSGTVVGLIVLEGDSIDQLYVDPEHTGEGIGTQLLDVAKANHPSGLQLWTFQSNHRARAFYERHGFVAVGMTDGDNEEGAPDVRYEWGAMRA